MGPGLADAREAAALTVTNSPTNAAAEGSSHTVEELSTATVAEEFRPGPPGAKTSEPRCASLRGRGLARAWVVAVVTALMVLIGLAGPAATQQDDGDEPPDTPQPEPTRPSLVISDVLGGSATPVDVNTGNTGTGSVEVWLRSDGEVSEARLVAIAEESTVTLSVDGQDTNAVFSLPPTRKLTITVSGVPRPGMYKGSINAEVGDELIPVADLVVVRRGEFSVEGSAVTDTALSESTERQSLTIPLTLESTDPQSRDALLTVDQLVAGTGEAVSTRLTGLIGGDVEVDGSKTVAVAVPGNGSVSFALVADLPVVSVYSSRIRVRGEDGGVEFARPISITRAGTGESSLTVATPEIGTIDDLWWWFSHTDASLRLSITEGNRGQALISDTEVRSLNLVEGDKRERVDEFGVTVEPEQLTIPRGETGTLMLTIEKLDRPGRYEGEVRLTTGNDTPVDVSFVVLVRRSAWVPFSVITLGVLVAALMRLLGARRGRLQGFKRVRRLWAQLQKLTADEFSDPAKRRFDAIHGHLQQRVSQVEGRVRRGAMADLDTMVKALEMQIFDVAPRWWLVLHLAGEQGQVAELGDELAVVESYLTSIAPDEASVGAATTKLGEAMTKLGSSRSVQEEIDLLRRSIEEDEVLLSADDRQQLMRSLDAAAAVTTNDPADARRRVDKVALDRIRALVRQALEVLPAEQPRPPGYGTDEAWSGDRAAIRDQLTAVLQVEDRAVAHQMYEEAMLELVGRLASALRNAIAGVVARFDGAEIPENVTAAADSATQELGHVDSAIGVEDASAAVTAYNQAGESYVAVIAAASHAGQEMGTAIESPRLTEVFVDVSLPDGAVAPTDLTELELTEEDKGGAGGWTLKHEGLLVVVSASWTLFAVIIIGLLGLQTLYFDNLTWGGLQDVIVAFVWGLGLHTGTALVEGAALKRGSNFPGAA